MAGLVARTQTTASGALGQIRSFVRSIGTGSLSPRRAERRSARARRWSFRVGHSRRRDRCICLHFYAVEEITRRKELMPSNQAAVAMETPVASSNPLDAIPDEMPFDVPYG